MTLQALLLRIAGMLAEQPSDELVVAQVDALKKRIPILYAVLSINTLAMAVTHQQAPQMISVFAPAALVALMTIRLVQWQRLADTSIGASEARRLLKRTTVLAAVMSSTTLAWALALYPYDGVPQTHAYGQVTLHGHTALFVGLTVICCITLLMHAIMPALVTALFVLLPFAGFLLWNGTLVEQAIAINLVLVSAAMVYVVFVFARDFEDLVTSRSRLREMNAYQTHLANSDALTGLSNRRSFHAVLAEAAGHGKQCTVLAIDLDGFKQINDLHGHATGDAVLSEIGGRIALETSDSLCTARIGGDEFGVILNRQLTDADARSYGNRIIAACNAPVNLETLTLSVGASVGIYNSMSSDGSEGGRYFERADYALFHAKQSGRNQVAVFRYEHEAQRKRGSHVEQVLRSSRLDDELAVLFQPIVNADTFELNSFEALARWSSPVLGQVAPAEFIPIAERSDLIHAVTDTVIKKALEQAGKWPARIKLRINLSARDLSGPCMPELIKQVERSAVDPERVTFEVTETALGSLDRILETAAMIKRTGISLAVDDFGTGYSSLSYIHRLRPDLIKIDRSFVSRLGKDDGAEAIIETIVALSRNVKARCLAEGVEEDGQVATLLKLGCDELQGFRFGHPMTAEEASALARTDRTLRASAS